MTPEATPALSLGMSTSAADATTTRFSPKPSPVIAVQVAMNAVLLTALVLVPSTRPAARTANPSAAVSLAVSHLTIRVARAAPSTRPPISGSSRRPLPIAFTPRMAWKSCGAANSRPNSAKTPNAARMVPQVNRADRNRLRSTSGCPPGRRDRRTSQPAKAARRAAPATIAMSAVAEVQPYCPAAMKP